MKKQIIILITIILFILLFHLYNSYQTNIEETFYIYEDIYKINKFNYGPNSCYNKLKNTGILINKDSIIKRGRKFGWGNSNCNQIFEYYKNVLKEKDLDINIYIPYCDYDPLVGQLGKTSCSKLVDYIDKEKYKNYIDYLKKEFGENVYIGVSCLYNGVKYYSNMITIPCYDSLFIGKKLFKQNDLDKYPWNKKKTEIVWRGGCSGECLYSLRRQVVDILYNNPKCNIQFTSNWCKKYDTPYIGQRINMKDQLKYKYILCIDGNGWPGNMEWIFFTGCVPVIISDWQIWFYKYLIPGYHFVKIKTDLSDLKEIVNDLLNNPNKYEHIAKNALAFSKKYLNPDAIKYYIRNNIV